MAASPQRIERLQELCSYDYPLLLQLLLRWSFQFPTDHPRNNGVQLS